MKHQLSASVKATAGEFVERLRRHFRDDLLDVRVFGSCSRGEAHEESDLDVFVLLRRAGWTERRAVLDIAGDLWLETDLLVSPTVMDEEQYRQWRIQERPLVMDIERDGISI